MPVRDPKSGVSGVDITVYTDVRGDHGAFKPTALAADRSGAKLGGADKELLNQLLPTLLEAANKALPKFGFPDIGGKTLSAKNRGLYGPYLILGAEPEAGTGEGPPEHVTISGEDGAWSYKFGCLIAVRSSLYASRVVEAVESWKDKLGLDKKQDFSSDDAHGHYTPTLRLVEVDGKHIDITITLDDFSITVDGPVWEKPSFDVTTHPREIHVDLTIGLLTEKGKIAQPSRCHAAHALTCTGRSDPQFRVSHHANRIEHRLFRRLPVDPNAGGTGSPCRSVTSRT
ncbi:hypothetical protein [Streptomyces sp. NPDC053720]|uniref:hypothetical protein n=1 Tax=Streptomyces sp. NPDC053720 TaxID=3154855 RepID=UPI00342879DF